MARVAVIGAGVIGASWAVLFSDHGWEVSLHDPAPVQSAQVMELVRVGAIRLAAGLEEAVAGADFVQEAGPERLDLKRELFTRLAEHTASTTVLASSSSSLLASEIARDNSHAERILIGHPFNPPELMPLVEVVPSPETADWARERALEVYAGLGKRPIALRKEIAGFVGNRLQRAVNLEARYLVEQGVIGPKDLDDLVRASIGLRWAVVGPFESQHLGGGPEGIRHLIDHVGSQMTFEPGRPSPARVAEIIDQVEQTYGLGATEYTERSRRRDRATRAVLEALHSAEASSAETAGARAGDAESTDPPSDDEQPPSTTRTDNP